METFRFRAMNTDVLFAAEGELSQLEEGFVEARRFVDDSEKRFSRFLVDSELSQLNRSDGDWFPASAEMVSVIFLALHCFEQTHGLFDPSILPDLKRAGYVESMDIIRQSGTVAVSDEIKPAKRPAFSEVKVDPLARTIFLPGGMSLDLGGIAKGWIVEQAALVLSKYAHVCAVNAGGDMFLIGLPEGQFSWPIGLEDPRDPTQLLTTLEVPSGALATSSISKRTWRQAEKIQHHLIDPRTGEAAETNWLSVTVIAPHTYLADVYAKALLIAGPGEAEQIASRESQISYLAVDRNGQCSGTFLSLEKMYGD